ncbi:hypothetical protein CC86DRAFT_374358 [Ophiobolus disseminans]|uniref:Uncharacterized protein n=1 Tax=Ophiobolus disseminans TaxID=1469910 RepID=A0A6A6ZKC4_9PLEO|nr:hypothetical protein CC86DRAFT_374358 [Ophiobolus disseminans]
MLTRSQSHPNLTTTISHSSHLPIPHPHIDRAHLSALLTSFLQHMFAPASCQACTSSKPCWTDSSAADYKCRIIVDDEFVLLEDNEEEEQDGGPLCREATIASWKMGGGKMPTMLGERRRRGSVHCYGGY